MGGKNFIGSFSYNIEEAEIIDECIKMAKEDGISFSEFIVSLLKEQTRKKIVGPSENPIGVLYNIYNVEKQKPLQSDLRDWLPRNEAIKKASKMPLDTKQWDHLAQTFHIIADKKRSGYL